MQTRVQRTESSCNHSNHGSPSEKTFFISGSRPFLPRSIIRSSLHIIHPPRHPNCYKMSIESFSTDSYFIYVSSNKTISDESLSTSDFYNTLYTPLQLESNHFEVALSSVWFKPIDSFFGNGDKNDSLLTITSKLGSVSVYTILEPSIFSVAGFVSEVNVVLETAGIIHTGEETSDGVEISTVFNKIHASTGSYQLTFSERISSMLGMSGRTLTGQDIELSNIDLYQNNNLYLVHCDLVPPQLFGSQYKQILKVFEQPHNTVGLQSSSFHPLQYVNVCVPNIDRIRLWVTNEAGQSVQFDENSGFTCLLHIKLKTL